MLRKNRAAQPPEERTRVISSTGPAPRSTRSEPKPPTVTRARTIPDAAPPAPATRTLDARGGKSARTASASRSSRLPGRRTALRVGGGLAAAALVVWGASAALGVVFSPEEEDWSSNLSEAVSMSPMPTSAEESCESGPGDTSSGPAVIAAFEHAYYSQRSGAAAREVVAPDSSLPQAAGIQAGINTIPTGTTHCVSVSEIGPDEFAATITEIRPSGQTRMYKQRIATVTAPDGRVLIKTISEVGE